MHIIESISSLRKEENGVRLPCLAVEFHLQQRFGGLADARTDTQNRLRAHAIWDAARPFHRLLETLSPPMRPLDHGLGALFESGQDMLDALGGIRPTPELLRIESYELRYVRSQDQHKTETIHRFSEPLVIGREGMTEVAIFHEIPWINWSDRSCHFAELDVSLNDDQQVAVAFNPMWVVGEEWTVDIRLTALFPMKARSKR